MNTLVPGFYRLCDVLLGGERDGHAGGYWTCSG